MSDSLSDIFSAKIIDRLRKAAADSLSADFRFRVLSLPHSDAGDWNSAPERQLYFETRQRWNLWIAAAVSAGLFRQPHGSELRSRLTGIDSDGFRSALAECMTCWALSSELGLRMQPRPCGRDGRILEFAADTPQGEVFFEVKSPRFRPSALFASNSEDSGAQRVYSAALAMRAALRAANRQFAPARRNILVLASPEVDSCSGTLSEHWPACLVRAFYGDHDVMTAWSDTGANPCATEGNFLKQPGGVPRYTRMSGVIGLQDSRFCSRVQATVLHNPCSRQAVESTIFGDWMQFAAIEGEMRCFRLTP
jgi:hypothetical protein